MKQELYDNLSIVIPAKNEEYSIRNIIKKCQRYSKNIIVIDGCSTDKTKKIAENCGVKILVDSGGGKGIALRESIQHIKTDIALFIDADGSHNPHDIPKLIKPILCNEADHVSASRLLGGSSELHGTFNECFRLMGSSFITACINWRFNVKLSESQNGFRAIRTNVLRILDLKEKITTIEQEMIIKTLKKGYKIAEIPSHENKRLFGNSNIKLSKVWFRYVYSLTKYLFF